VVAVAATPAAWVAAEADASSSVTKGSFMSDDYLLIRTPHGKIAKPTPPLGRPVKSSGPSGPPHDARVG